MISGNVLLLVLLAVPSQQAPDSAGALRQAKELVLEQYDNIAITGRFNSRGVSGSGRACVGVSLQDCMPQGDWSCLDTGCAWDHAERRADLIPKLEELARVAGNAEWLFRQRVGFAIKNEELERADTIANACPDEEWWCQTLRGLTAHRLHPGRGLAHFDTAFVLVAEKASLLPPGGAAWGTDPDAKCQWSHIRAVVPKEMLDEVQGLRCPEVEELSTRFWWLADPLWIQEGNERYAEHLARLVTIRMDLDVQEFLHAAAVEGRYDRIYWESHASWEHVVREGWPNSNTDACWNPPGSDRGYGCPGNRLQYVHGGYSFAPDENRLRRPQESTAEDWAVQWRNGGCHPPWSPAGCGRRGMPRLQPPKNPLAGYDGCKPPWKLEDCGAERMITRERWHNLEHQTVVLRRGGQLLFVSAARVPGRLGPAENLRPALALGRPADLDLEVVPATLDGEGVFRARALVDTGDYLASIEVVGPEEIGRARFGVPVNALNEGFGVSDLGLVDPRFETDSLTLVEALLPSPELPADGRVGLYFEVYGLEEDEAVEFTLASERTDPSVLSRLGRFLRLTSKETPRELIWSDPGGEDQEITSRFFSFDLSNLDEGEYSLRLNVRREDGNEAAVSRQIRLR